MRSIALSQIKKQDNLFEIALGMKNSILRNQTINHIKNEYYLTLLILFEKENTEQYFDNVLRIINKIKNPRILFLIELDMKNFELDKIIIAKINSSKVNIILYDHHTNHFNFSLRNYIKTHPKYKESKNHELMDHYVYRP